jgi:hypothetical protein
MRALGLESLRDTIAGEVVAPGDAGWDQARLAWNLLADQHPALVVIAGEDADIASTVRFARGNGLRVAAQATGHGATSLGDLRDAILLQTSRLNGISIDPQARTARVQAGTLWRDVIAAAAGHGLVGLHGMSGGVGVIGYTLGGGIGWLARREGFASSHVRGFEVVTADGEERHVDVDHEPDVFWALRGGGGNPAIVTGAEFALFELREAFAGSLLWPLEQAHDVAHGYLAWIATVPDTVTSTLKLMRFPPLPAIPEPLRGRAVAMVTLAFTGDEAQGTELVAPLRAIAPPYLDTVTTIPAAGLGDIAGDPQEPLPAVGRAALLQKLTAETVDAYVELAGPGVNSPLTILEIRHLGGALAAEAGDSGAAGPLEAEALVYGTGSPATPEMGAGLNRALEAMSQAMAPWTGQRRTLLTFDEQGPGIRGAFPNAVAERLASVSSAYDPDRRIMANHSLD